MAAFTKVGLIAAPLVAFRTATKLNRIIVNIANCLHKIVVRLDWLTFIAILKYRATASGHPVEKLTIEGSYLMDNLPHMVLVIRKQHMHVVVHEAPGT